MFSRFNGKKCEKLTSLSFHDNNAFVEILLENKPHTNITMLIATKQTQGILMYQGFDQHIAVEVFLRMHLGQL